MHSLHFKKSVRSHVTPTHPIFLLSAFWGQGMYLIHFLYFPYLEMCLTHIGVQMFVEWMDEHPGIEIHNVHSACSVCRTFSVCPFRSIFCVYLSCCLLWGLTRKAYISGLHVLCLLDEFSQWGVMEGDWKKRGFISQALFLWGHFGLVVFLTEEICSSQGDFSLDSVSWV